MGYNQVRRFSPVALITGLRSDRDSPSPVVSVQETMSFEVPSTDTIYISGMPQNVTEQDLIAHFGQIGKVKIDKKTKREKVGMGSETGPGGNRITL